MGELVILLIVVLILFGGKKWPQLGRSMGQALVNFKKGITGREEEKKEEKEA